MSSCRINAKTNYSSLLTINKNKDKTSKSSTMSMIFHSTSLLCTKTFQKRLARFLSTEKITHTNEKGEANMVNVGEKKITNRTATAIGTVYVGKKISKLIQENNVKKGDVLSVARIAGIMGAKRTSELIPLCHNIVLDDIKVEAKLEGETVVLKGEVKCNGKTGVEMEALVAVSIAALTIYDMCKGVSHEMCIGDIKLVEKTGGSKGDFHRENSSKFTKNFI